MGNNYKTSSGENTEKIIHTIEGLKSARNAKIRSMFNFGEQVWIVHEQANIGTAEIHFSIIRRLSRLQGTGWARIRYRYDGLGNILHYLGEAPLMLAEVEALSADDRFYTGIW
ncbi:MAG: hypothetical protein EXR62_03190 [Chloroflexi bacterium]|nr:hypothetical protein [Chloroflexota bacterium]